MKIKYSKGIFKQSTILIVTNIESEFSTELFLLSLPQDHMIEGMRRFVDATIHDTILGSVGQI